MSIWIHTKVCGWVLAFQRILTPSQLLAGFGFGIELLDDVLHFLDFELLKDSRYLPLESLEEVGVLLLESLIGIGELSRVLGHFDRWITVRREMDR